MDHLNFIYESHTPGHALKPVVILPEVIKQLKAHCLSNKCKPVAVLEAIYDFQTLPNKSQRTFNHLVISCVKGKPAVTINKIIKETHIEWVFGIPLKEDEYREC